MRASGTPVQLGIRISRELHKRLKIHCVEADITHEEFVTQAIEEKLSKLTWDETRHADNATHRLRRQ